mgnify:CR=1 FL=1|tara:strand:+ start:301 stop:675 length:375 start_codon:yes stop_codon:yes gene_type:complete
MIFKEEVKVTDKQVIITVSCKVRKYAHEKKHIYNKLKIQSLIPKDLKEKVQKNSEPTTIVSNLSRKNHKNEGTWVFNIISEKESLISSKKDDIIKTEKESNTSNDTTKTQKSRTRTRRSRTTKN